MLYYLFEYLDKFVDFPGAGVFRFISFRAAMALLLSLVISAVFGKRLIAMLRRRQVGETVRDLGLQGQMRKPAPPPWAALSYSGPSYCPYCFLQILKTYILY